MDKEKNIKQLVIIGNGFDLQCGLKSKFTDYFNYVKSKMNEQDETLLKGNEINYGNTLPHSEFYLNFASFWDCYFLSLELLEDNQDYDWCNVEKQIEILLTSNKNENIGEINGKILFDLLYLGSLNGLTNLKFHSQLNNMMKKQIKSKIQNGNQISLVENIINKLSFYISLSLDKRIQDNLKNNDNLNELISNYKPIFYSYLFKQLEKFENNLKAYLQLLFQKKESTDSKANKENNAISCSEVAMDFSYYLQCYRKILYKITEGNKYNLLSFNYTYFSKALLSTTSSLGMISPVVERMHPINCVVSKNIHGDLDGHIIIGIDELSINESDPLYRFTKTYRILGLEDHEESCLSKSIKEIIFYGHSLAKADYSYFQSIFDFYHIYDSNVKLIFYYSNYCDNKEKCKFETVNRVIKLIKTYGNTLNNKDHGKNLLHKLKLENRLIIKELKDW